MSFQGNSNSIQSKFVSLYRNIPFAYKLAFGATFCTGFLCNLFVFTNNLINHDTLNEGFKNMGWSFSIEQGRWLQYIVRSIGTIFPSPVIHGLFGLIALSLAAAILCSIFHIKDSFFVILLSALLGVFPINACFFSYMYMAESFYVSLFFACLSVFFVERKGFKNFMFAAISLLCSIAIYQAFVSISIALIVALYFLKLLDVEHFVLKEWFITALRDTLMVIIGFILYAIITKIILLATSINLHTYGGVSNTFSFSFDNIPLSIAITLIDIKTFYFSTVWIQHKMFLLANIIIACLFFIVMLRTIFHYVKHKKYVMLPICIAYYIVLPFLLDNIFIIMNLRGDVHMLMHYAYIMPYIMLIALLPDLFSLFSCGVGELRHLRQRMANFLTLSGLLAITLIIYFSFIISNQLYCRMSNNMTAANANLTAMLARIESIENWDLSQPVYIANAHSILNTNLYADLYFYDQIGSVFWVGTDVYPWGGNNQVYDYLSRYFNIDLVQPTYEEEKQILASKTFADMPIYPAKDSIKVINGIIVVKMEEQ